MQEVELFRWWVTAPGRRRPYLTSFLMDAATAQATYPGARPDPSTRIVRLVPNTEAERAEAHYHYPSAGRNDPTA
jgi:hypothetical protein